MQVGGFDKMLAQAIAEAVAPLAERIRQLEEQVSEYREKEYTDIAGKKAIVKLLGCSEMVWRRLTTTQVMGHGIYKTGEGPKAHLHCLVRETVRRYDHYMHLSEREKQAWEMLGADLAERKWKEIGL